MEVEYKSKIMDRRKAFNLVSDNLCDELFNLNMSFVYKPKIFNSIIDNMILELNGLKKLNVKVEDSYRKVIQNEEAKISIKKLQEESGV